MKYLIVADGDELDVSAIKAFNVDHTLVALDGAANHLVQHSIYPYHIVGDLDSIDRIIMKQCKHKGVEVVIDKCADTTDLDKGIQLCANLGATEVVIINALGNMRVDHMIYNYMIWIS